MIEKQTENLSAIVQAAQQYHDLAVQSQATADVSRLEAGRYLLAARKLIGKGSWMQWVSATFSFSYETACRYIRRAESMQNVAAKCIPEIVAAVEVGQITIEDADSVAEAPHDQQRRCLERVQSGVAATLLQTLEDGWASDDEPQEPDPNQPAMVSTEKMCRACARRVRVGLAPLSNCPTCDAVRNELISESPPPEPTPEPKPGKLIRDWLGKIRQELGNQDHGDPHYNCCMERLSELQQALQSWPALEVPPPRNFTAPTLAEVTEYCDQRSAAGNPRINPAMFHAHYEENGWMRGDKKMINWKLTVVMWEEKQRERSAGNGGVRSDSRVGLDPGTLDRIEAKTIRTGEAPIEYGEVQDSDNIPG